MKARAIERRVLELAEPAAEAVGARVLDVQFVREGNDQYLRIYIEKDSGVSIEDCADVNNQVGKSSMRRISSVATSFRFLARRDAVEKC